MREMWKKDAKTEATTTNAKNSFRKRKTLEPIMIFFQRAFWSILGMRKHCFDMLNVCANAVFLLFGNIFPRLLCCDEKRIPAEASESMCIYLWSESCLHGQGSAVNIDVMPLSQSNPLTEHFKNRSETIWQYLQTRVCVFRSKPFLLLLRLPFLDISVMELRRATNEKPIHFAASH